MSVQRAKQETTANEMLDWSIILKQQAEQKYDREKNDYYYAQIAAEIRRSYVKHPKDIQNKDFLLQTPAEMKLSSSSEEQTKKKRTQTAKCFWFGLLGIKDKIE